MQVFGLCMELYTRHILCVSTAGVVDRVSFIVLKCRLLEPFDILMKMNFCQANLKVFYEHIVDFKLYFTWTD